MAENTSVGVRSYVAPESSVIYMAPLGTPVPAVGEEFPSPWVAVGFLSEDGFSIDPGIEDGDDLIVFGNVKIGKTASRKNPSIVINFVDTGNKDVLQLVAHPADIVGTENNFRIAETDLEPLNKMLGGEMLNKTNNTNQFSRFIIEHAQFLTKSANEYDGNSLDSQEVTYEMRRDSQKRFFYTDFWKEDQDGNILGGGTGK